MKVKLRLDYEVEANAEAALDETEIDERDAIALIKSEVSAFAQRLVGAAKARGLDVRIG